MKELRKSEVNHQGFKEAYLSSIEHPRKLVESSFSSLDMKGRKIKIFQPYREEKEIVDTLNRIEPLITSDDSIPHLRSKLSSYPSLERFLEEHLTDGLYLLQFRKCDDASCCTKLTSLPPHVPSPVLGPDKKHYLSFNDLYGKVKTTEKDCPSLSSKAEAKKANPNFKFLSSRVVAALECCLCGKSRCVFSMSGSITVKGQQELEDIIFSCGMSLLTPTLYTARFLKCSSPIEAAFDIFAKRNITINTTQPTCLPSEGVVGVTEKNKQQKRISNFFSSSTKVSISPATSVSEISTTSVSATLTTSVSVTPAKSVVITIEPNQEKMDEDIDFVTDIRVESSSKEDTCIICGEEDPPGTSKKVQWVDCDICRRWAHLRCATGIWKNIRRKNWECNRNDCQK